MAITDEITRLQIAKSNIKTSIESKGVIVPEEATLDVYAPLIDTIETQGLYQEKSVTPKVEDQVVKPDEGFDALSKVVVEKTPLEEKTVTPSTAGEIVEPSMGKIGMSKVTVMGDMNLTSSNIKDGVTIFGVTGNYGASGEGGGGDDYSALGTTVSVYARNSFMKGEIFMGEKNPDLAGTMLYDVMNVPSYIRAWNKKNLDIVAFTTTLRDSSTYYALGIYNEEKNEYERITVDLPSGYVETVVQTSNAETLINDDGTKIVILQSDNGAAFGFEFSLLIINVNKSAKTASVTKVAETDFGVPSYPITFEYEGQVYEDGRQLRGSRMGGVLAKKYLIIGGYISSSSANDTTPINCLIALKESQGTYKFNNIILVKKNIGYPTRKTFRMISDNEAVAMCGNYGVKFHFGEGGVSASVSFEYSKTITGNYSMNVTNLSKNGKYMCAKAVNDVGEVYEVDFGSGTYESIYSITNATYCDSSGRYVLAQDGDSKEATLYMNGEVLAEGVKSCEDDYFEFTADEFYVHSKSDVPYICYRNPEDFDYYIYNTQAYIETSDRIYGIVPESMAMGDVGKAQALFNTFTS